MPAGIDGLQLIGYNKVTSATDAIPLHYHKDTIEMDPFEGVNEQIWFHISRSLLYQHFKQQTPVDYINSQKVARAQELLINGNLNLTEIALQLGFESSSYCFCFVHSL